MQPETRFSHGWSPPTRPSRALLASTFALSTMLTVWASSAVEAQNLIVNPGFTSDLTGWTRSGFEGVWNPEDADGDPSSGSGYLSFEGSPAGGAYLASSCMQVVAGTTYDVRAEVRLPLSQPLGTTDLTLRGYTSPNCLGFTSAGAKQAVKLRRDDSTGLWTPIEGTYTPGDGVLAVKLEVGASKNEEGDAEFFVDNVEFCVEGTCNEGGGSGGDACVRDEQTACLLDGRFQVTVEWTDFESNDGAGMLMEFDGARAESNDSAFFYFFTPTNFEIGVKMVDACTPPFDRFWVFTSGLTNVAFLVRVLDTETGTERAYGNPLGMLPQTQGDTSAFFCD